MQARPSRVLRRIADGVARHRGLVGVGALAAEDAGLNVPGARTPTAMDEGRRRCRTLPEI